MSLALPVTLQELTPTWLTSALSERYPGVAVKDAQVAGTTSGTATKQHLRLKYNAIGDALQLPSAVVVKGGFSTHRLLLERIYAMEARFYREILPRLPINAPRCLYAGDDPERQQHLVILEDLNPRGARFCRVQNPLDFRQAAAFLDIIARYTAQWWDSEELARLKLWHWDPLPDDEMGVYQWGQLQPDVWSRFVALPRGTALPKFLHDREQMQRALLRLKAFDRQGPMCFLHGDFHLGNLYHEADGTPGVLDWQCYCTGPWSHDVTYFLVSALDIADRRRWDRALIAHFLERLSELGVAPPSFDEAWDAYRRQIVDGLYFWLVNPPEFQSEENNCAVAPRFAAAAVDHDTFELMA